MISVLFTLVTFLSNNVYNMCIHMLYISKQVGWERLRAENWCDNEITAEGYNIVRLRKNKEVSVLCCMFDREYIIIIIQKASSYIFPSAIAFSFWICSAIASSSFWLCSVIASSSFLLCSVSSSFWLCCSCTGCCDTLSGWRLGLCIRVYATSHRLRILLL